MLHFIPLSDELVSKTIAILETTKATKPNSKIILLSSGSSDIFRAASTDINCMDYDNIIYASGARTLFQTNIITQQETIVSDATMLLLLHDMLQDFDHPMYRDGNKRSIHKNIINSLNEYYLRNIQNMNSFSEEFLTQVIQAMTRYKEREKIIMRSEAWRKLLNNMIHTKIRKDIIIFAMQPIYFMPHINEFINILCNIGSNNDQSLNIIVNSHRQYHISHKIAHETHTHSQNSNTLAEEYIHFVENNISYSNWRNEHNTQDANQNSQNDIKNTSHDIKIMQSDNIISQAHHIVNYITKLSTQHITIASSNDNLSYLLHNLINIKLNQPRTESYFLESKMLHLLLDYGFQPSNKLLTQILHLIDQFHKDFHKPDHSQFQISQIIATSNTNDLESVFINHITDPQKLNHYLHIISKLTEWEVLCATKSQIIDIWDAHIAITQLILTQCTYNHDFFIQIDNAVKENHQYAISCPDTESIYRDLIKAALNNISTRRYDVTAQQSNIEIVPISKILTIKTENLIFCPSDTLAINASYISDTNLNQNASKISVHIASFAKTLSHKNAIISMNKKQPSYSFSIFEGFAKEKNIQMLDIFDVSQDADHNPQTSDSQKPPFTRLLRSSASYLPPRYSLPKQFSASSLEMLIKNPYLYYIQYILKIRSINRSERSNSHIKFGITVHETLSHTKFSESRKSYIEHFLHTAKQILENDPHFFNMWRNRLTNVAKQVFPYISKESISEQTLRDNFALFTHHPEIKIMARCDNIVADMNTSKHNVPMITIIDYKTGQLPSKKDVLSWRMPQLQVEGLLICKILKQIARKNTSPEEIGAKLHTMLSQMQQYTPQIHMRYLQLDGKSDRAQELICEFDAQNAENTLKNILAPYYISQKEYTNTEYCPSEQYQHVLRMNNK